VEIEGYSCSTRSALFLFVCLSEIDPNSSFVAETTTAVHQAVAHLNSLGRESLPHKTTFNRDVVACMVEDVWANVMQVRVWSCMRRAFGRANDPSPSLQHGTFVHLLLSIAPVSVCMYVGPSPPDCSFHPRG
jgi:hypothetical protein